MYINENVKVNEHVEMRPDGNDDVANTLQCCPVGFLAAVVTNLVVVVVVVADDKQNNRIKAF